jgi:hypothetical protein
VVGPLRTRNGLVCTSRERRLNSLAEALAVRLTFAAEAVGVPDRIASSLDMCPLVRSFLVADHW